MSSKARRTYENRDIRMLAIQRGEEDNPDYAELMDSTPCPECRGRCEDKHGDPCGWCHGEGEIYPSAKWADSLSSRTSSSRL